LGTRHGRRSVPAPLTCSLAHGPSSWITTCHECDRDPWYVSIGRVPDRPRPSAGPTGFLPGDCTSTVPTRAREGPRRPRDLMEDIARARRDRACLRLDESSGRNRGVCPQASLECPPLWVRIRDCRCPRASIGLAKRNRTIAGLSALSVARRKRPQRDARLGPLGERLGTDQIEFVEAQPTETAYGWTGLPGPPRR